MAKKIKKLIKKTTKNKVVKKSKPKPKKAVRKKPAKKKPVRKLERKRKSAAGGKVVKKPAKKVVKKPKLKFKKVVKKPVKKVKPKIKKKSVKRKIVKKLKVKKVVRKPVRKVKLKKKVIKRKIVKKARPKKVVKRTIKKSRPRKGRGPSIRRRRKSGPTKPRIYVGKGPLEQLFESQAKVKLLRFFFRNPEEFFQPKDVFKRLRSSTVLLRQEMKKLEKLGLIKQKKVWLTFEKKRGGERKEQKMVSYLNTNFDFFDELRSLVLKSAVASKDDLVDSAKKVGNIKLLVLAGVFTGDETARADLLIVGDRINSKKLNNFIKEVEAEVGKAVNCAVLTTKEFNYRYDMYDRFVRDLLNTNCEILIRKLDLW